MKRENVSSAKLEWFLNYCNKLRAVLNRFHDCYIRIKTFNTRVKENLDKTEKKFRKSFSLTLTAKTQIQK